MNKWKYNLEATGKSFRESLTSEVETAVTVINVYRCTINCLNSLKKMLSKTDSENWLDEIESMIEDMKMACPENDSDFDYEEQEDNLNCYLNDFYNLLTICECG